MRHQRISMKKRSNQKFNSAEDEVLKMLVHKYGESNWQIIADHMQSRNVRQCHDRWFYYLSPQISKQPWTEEDDKRLVKLAENLNGRWVEVSKHFPGRTDTQIKNRWNVLKKTMVLPEFHNRRNNSKSKEKKKEVKSESDNQIVEVKQSGAASEIYYPFMFPHDQCSYFASDLDYLFEEA